MDNNEIVDALSGVWYLATCEDDQPHVRPLDKAAEVDGRVYFGTSRTKKMTSQIIQNPRVEVFAMNELGAVRFMAEAYVEEDDAKAKEAFEKMGKPYDDASSVAVVFDKIRKV